jgi:hypothetical protein
MADYLDEDAADADGDTEESTADIEYYEDSDSSSRE